MDYANPYESPRTLSRDNAEQTLFARETAFGIDRTWGVAGPAGSQIIRVRHGYWSGRAKIEADGEVVYFRARKLADWGLVHSFFLDGMACTVKVSPCFLRFRYELFVDDSKRAADG